MTRGILRGIEEGWFMSEIAEAAFQYQTALEKGEKKIVGVNCHQESVTHDLEILRVSHEVEVDQVRELAARKEGRDEAAVDAAIGRMLEAARWRREHDPGDARGLPGRGHARARSATRCAPSGASTGSRPASDRHHGTSAMPPPGSPRGAHTNRCPAELGP